MRRTLGFRLVAALTFLAVSSALVGCGGQPQSSGGAGTQYTINMPWGTFKLSAKIAAHVKSALASNQPLDIPVFTWISGDVIFIPIRKGIEDAAKKYHTTSSLIGPVGASQPEEVNDINSYLGRNPDGMSVILESEESAISLINGLVDQGIPVIMWNGDAPHTHRLAFIGQDMPQAGYHVGQLMVAKLKAKNITSGTIAIFATAADADYAKGQRIPGFEKAVHEAIPDIKFQTPVTLGTDISAAVGKVDAAVRGKSDIVGMYSADEQIIAAGVWEKQNASPGKYILVGHNVLPQELQLMSDGYLDGLVGQNPYNQGYESVKWLYTFVTTGKVDCTFCDTGFPTVDSADKAKALLASNCDGAGCG